MKLVPAITCLFAAVLSTVAPAFADVPLLGPLPDKEQKVVDFARSVAVQIRADVSDTFQSQDNEAICSGTIVGYDQFEQELIVMTAKHCTSGDDEGLKIIDKTVVLENGDHLTVDKVYPCSAADLAFLTVHANPGYAFTHPLAKFADDEVSQGEGVFFYGMPAGTPWALQFARGLQGPIFHSTPKTGDAANPLFAIDCPNCGPGDSGAAVFDAWGHIKGVLVMGRGVPEMILYVPLAIVKIAYRTFLATR